LKLQLSCGEHLLPIGAAWRYAEVADQKANNIGQADVAGWQVGRGQEVDRSGIRAEVKVRLRDWAQARRVPVIGKNFVRGGRLERVLIAPMSDSPVSRFGNDIESVPDVERERAAIEPRAAATAEASAQSDIGRIS